MSASFRAEGLIKVQAVLTPPKRGGIFQRTRADIVIKNHFTIFVRDSVKKSTGLSFVRKWLYTPARWSSRRVKVKLNVKTNLPFAKSVDVNTVWIMPRAGHRKKKVRSVICLKCI